MRKLVPACIGALAVAISAVQSTRPSLWSDEAATTTAAQRTLPQLWAMAHNIDAVHALYYAFMHAWIRVFGIDALSLRAPSLLAVGLAAAGVVVLGRMISTDRVAICSGLVFCILPRVTWMAIEARSSALTATCAVWLTVVLLSALRGARRWWVVYAVLAGVSVMLNIYLALLVVAHGLTLLLGPSRWRRLLEWATASVGGAALSSPLWMIALRQTGQLPFGALTLEDWARYIVVNQWFLGATPTQARIWTLSFDRPWSVAALGLAGVCWLAMVGAVAVPRLRPPRAPDSPVTPLTLVIPWLVLPVVVVFAYSELRTTIYSPRYFCFATPAVALLVGAALAGLRRRWSTVAFVVIAVLTLPVFLSQRTPTAKNGTDWSQASEAVARGARPGDAVLFANYRPSSDSNTRRMSVVYPEPFAGLEDLTHKLTGVQADNLYGRSYRLGQVPDRLDGVHRVWVVASVQHPGRVAARQDVSLLRRHGFVVTERWRGPQTRILEATR